MILTNAQRGITIGRRPKKKIKEVTEPFQMEDGTWLYSLGWKGKRNG